MPVDAGHLPVRIARLPELRGLVEQHRPEPSALSDFNNLTGFVNEPQIWGVQFEVRF